VVGAGPLMLDVMAVIAAPVGVVETELEVELEIIVAFPDVGPPPFFPPLSPPVGDGVAEASIPVVDCPSRLCR
jgi:hypothetical protein